MGWGEWVLEVTLRVRGGRHEREARGGGRVVGFGFGSAA